MFRHTPAVFVALFCSTALAQPPLTATTGDAEQGRAIFLDRERGHCLLCHQVVQLDAGFQGNIGPPLSNVGGRLSSAQIRARVIDPTQLNPDTVMPAYYRTEGLRQVGQAYQQKPILDAQEVEHVVAFVSSLVVVTDD